MEVEGRHDDEEDQQDREEARTEIDRDHQTGEDLEAADAERQQLRHRHARHGFELRGIGREHRGDGHLGCDEVRRLLKREELGRSRVHEEDGEQDSPEGN